MSDAKFEIRNNDYGFVWGDVLVERSCSQANKYPKFQILRIFLPNKEIIQLTIQRRKTKVERLK